MKALFVIEQFPDCNPELGRLGPSGPEESYLRTWEELDIGPFKVVHYDNRPVGDTMAEIWAITESFRPDVVVFTEVFNHPGAQLHSLWPGLSNNNIPVVAIWHDSMKGGFRVLPGVSLNVLADTRLPRPDIPNSLPLWTPHNSRDFFRGNETRDIDVLFCSSRGHKSLPAKWIEEMARLGVSTTWVGGLREEKLTLAECSALCRRAKIGINFSQDTPTAAHQLKGRIMDILCSGAMLLEQKNPHTWRMLHDGIDYVAFDSPFSLWNQAQHFLSHEPERLAIAESGWSRSQTDYCSKAWWNAVLSSIGKPL